MSARVVGVVAGCAVGFLALSALVLWLITFHVVGAPALFVWLAALVLLIGASLLGRSVGAVFAAILGTGLYLAVMFIAGPAMVQDYVLDARGVTVTAVTVGVTDGNFVTQGNKRGARGRGVGESIRTVDGRALRGVVSSGADHLGARVTVVADPEGAVDSRVPDALSPVADTILVAVGALISAGVWLAAGLSWGARRRKIGGGR
jgi:hypothetical protein